MSSTQYPLFLPFDYGGQNKSRGPGEGLFDPRRQTPRDLVQQLIISIMLGLGAFISFCLLRPKWPQFYYARKIRIRTAAALPDLPPTFFGWIPSLWRISDADVLATAGLDAYVFLAFFKMAIQFLFIATILAGAVLVPVHTYFGSGDFFKEISDEFWGNPDLTEPYLFDDGDKKPLKPIKTDPSILWANLIFVYIFSGLAFYFIWQHTENIVHVRQKYLGQQSTVTSRTVKLSGIPLELRSEGTLKDYIDKLGIGKVEEVTLCRQWKDLDNLLDEREKTIRKLEEVRIAYDKKKKRTGLSLLQAAETIEEAYEDESSDEETAPLLSRSQDPRYRSAPGRPKIIIRYGKFGLKVRRIDAISHLHRKLAELDDEITIARRKDYPATPLAFITMDSVTAAQIMMQTLIDPTPGCLIARQAPFPSDINWHNVYLSRRNRLTRGWSISIFVTLSSVFWLIPVAALAGLWNMDEIHKIWPGLADVLEANEIVASLVTTFLPTLVLTLLNIAVPFFYEWLSQQQGMISQEEVELSIISKNFFFTFFNLFLAFTIFGTAFTFHTFWETLRDSFKDTASIALLLAKAVEGLGPFYINLIILQGLGMFPLRLLQIGTVTLYPYNKVTAKTPRDRSELRKAPLFQYGFYLPQPILVFIICLVYSVLQRGVLILFFGLLYFICGYFTYKYQLLYAMEHPRYSAGKAWTMIVNRVIMGLGVFQLTMAGWLVLRQAFTRAGLVLPLLAFTAWSGYVFRREWGPAHYFTALKSIKKPATPISGLEQEREEEGGTRYVNPSLVSELRGVWLSDRTEDYGFGDTPNGAHDGEEQNHGALIDLSHHT
ncbi:hypothetical protein FPQ18DRAFT_327805 [Pyronema domesticum]|uniref:Similar to Uncharacterized membrane protein YLR241W acc. no. Q06538 n=1 Tax=Pyronema omphalodes (strain CBS 100304) TaxID=1076935 RepID=U4L755_PYROM|nr:hypothetical protein FPQ18DRAFT_327805 [Pyronema domesticum]CCX13254.1 Similar to Uncharacterized membrane protein YLR241W; acc. no. Q06538 [Pyronema omphalodes CBS 100304]